MTKVLALFRKFGFHLEVEGEAVDLVCGMEIDPKESKNRSEYGGKIYYFCSKNCKDHFEANPEKYIG